MCTPQRKSDLMNRVVTGIVAHSPGSSTPGDPRQAFLARAARRNGSGGLMQGGGLGQNGSGV